MIKINTTISQMLGIDLPVIGAPMFLVSYADLVVAVSEAGGIGTFPTVNFRSLNHLRDGLSEIRERTKKPIGANLVLYKDHNPDWAKHLEICLEYKVELLITSLGSPRSVVKEAKAVGTKVFADVTTLKHARIVRKSNVDAIVCVAGGAGGHAGSISPFSLIPYIKKETTLPVIAAGSIGTGAQMAAALALGADAVYVGTRLIATPEAAADDKYKQMILESKPEDIVYTDQVSGINANWLAQSLQQANLAKSDDSHLNLQQESKRWKDIWSAGHGVAQINKILPATEVIQNMARDYLEIKKQLP